jgi:hypothetical protein
MNKLINLAHAPVVKVNKAALTARPKEPIQQTAKPAMPKPAAVRPAMTRPVTPQPLTTHPENYSRFENDLGELRKAAVYVHQIRLKAEDELELARRMRADAQRYQQETETRARSQAHQLVLHARLESQKEIEELVRHASTEIQKVLADIRAIRITAQEELATQEKFTNAARLRTLSLSMREEAAESEENNKKQLVFKK